MGKEFQENALMVNVSREYAVVSGYVSLPTLNKSNSLSEYLFVNNRPVRDKLLLGAIKGAYQDVLASNRYPMVALFIDVNPQYVDVNVHPQKAEVRFFDGGLIRSLVVGAIRQALSAGDKKAANTLNLEEFVKEETGFESSPKLSEPATQMRFNNPSRPFQNFHSSKAQTLPDLERAYSVKVDFKPENETFEKNQSEVIKITKDPIVSSDIIGKRYGAIVDTLLTNMVDVNGKKLYKVIAWYDNEFGYTVQMMRTAKSMFKNY